MISGLLVVDSWTPPPTCDASKTGSWGKSLTRELTWVRALTHHHPQIPTRSISTCSVVELLDKQAKGLVGIFMQSSNWVPADMFDLLVVDFGALCDMAGLTTSSRWVSWFRNRDTQDWSSFRFRFGRIHVFFFTYIPHWCNKFVDEQ